MFWPFVHKTPLRRQLDPIECGGVCLAIILESYGLNIPSLAIKDAVQTSRRGSDAASIIKAAQQFGFFSRAFRLLASEIKAINQKAILFVDQSHFVVFEGYFLGRYYINDPARGRYSLGEREFRKRFSHIVIEVVKPSEPSYKHAFENVSQRINIKQNIGAFNNIFYILLGFSLAILFAFFSLAAGFLGSSKKLSIDVDLTYIIASFIVLLFLLIIGCAIYWRSLNQSATSSCLKEIQQLSEGLSEVKASFFEEIPFAAFFRVFVKSMDRALLITMGQAQQYFFISFLLINLLVIASISWAVAMVFFLIFLVCQCQIKLSSSSTIDPQYDALSSILSQSIDMRAMGQEKYIIDKLMQQEVDGIKITQKSFWQQVILSFILPIAIGLIIICWIMSVCFHNGYLVPQEIYALILLGFGYIYATLKIIDLTPDQKEALVLLADMSYGRSEKPTVVDDNVGPALIELKGISFTYRGEQQAVWRHLNLTINRKEIIAFVAEPLAGVSTLIKLIGGKLVPSSGDIFHFAKDKNPLRVAIIDEDADLFSGTLKDNVTLLDESISEQAIIFALKQACALDLFYNRPFGLLTPIFASGKNLSHGEKKRLLLAQVLTHKPDIILLDNFFETLDETTAQKIIDNLTALQITVVFNSYRSSELAKADRVIFIDNQTLLINSHDHLMASHESYQRLVITPRNGGQL